MRAQKQNQPWHAFTVRFSIMAAFSSMAVFSSAAAQVRAPKIPDVLHVPDAEVLVLKARGEGVQIYQCKGTADAAGAFQWVFEAPEADLVDDQGQKIGKHYAGPTWEAHDGSKVVGQLQQHADATNPSAIPWLLLKAKSNEGTGIFKDVNYIQRLDTEGGKAPATGCERQNAGEEARARYAANYYFYRSSTPADRHPAP
jgi:Protein of unknown function (DUF3455)